MIAGYERTTVIDPAASSSYSFDPIDVLGVKPPTAGGSWWPWIIGAGVLAGLWYLTRERPLGKAAGP